MLYKDVIIIGAGAAGLMCAAEAGKRGRSVLVLDHATKTGSKIRASGGGRCNFTNLRTGPDNYISANPHFCKSALARFTPGDFISLLDRHAVRHQEKEQGRLFCTRNSLDIIHMLQKECEGAGVETRLQCRVSRISKTGVFLVATNQGAFRSASLVIATGGLSYPELGATGFGYHAAKEFGLAVTSLRPGLAPLTFNKRELDMFSRLSGISLEATVRCNRKEFRENILFTHKGLSGPAALQISLYWNNSDTITVDLLPGTDLNDLLVTERRSRMELRNLLSEFFPRRFIQEWLHLSAVESKPVCRYSDEELKTIAARIHNWEIRPHGIEGYSRAEVTVGGVDTSELSSKTMEAKKVPGLHFIGEVIDVTGQLGGYNLQWAWSSGYTAGQYV